VVNIYIGKQKVVWILKLRENGWEAAASTVERALLLCTVPLLHLTQDFLLSFLRFLVRNSPSLHKDEDMIY
jgi:hypothetical protein